MAISKIENASLATSAVGQSNMGAGVVGTGPAFSAYANGGQAVSSNTYTKVQFNTEIFDTANCFDNSTNYRFTPNIAGYYQINAQAGVNSGSAGSTITAFIYRNGSAYLNNSHDMYTGNYQFANASDTIYMNGTTDYLEVYVYIGYSANVLTGTSSTRFSGCLVRAA